MLTKFIYFSDIYFGNTLIAISTQESLENENITNTVNIYANYKLIIFQ